MEALLTEVAKPAVEVLVSRAKEEIHYIRNFKDELKKLLRKIQMIGSIVGSMTQVKDAAVEEWLRNAVGSIYDAEYLLDVLGYEKHRAVVRKRRPKKPFMMRKMRLLILGPLKKAYFRSRMGSRIRSITGDFEDALREAHTIVQLKQLAQHSASGSASTSLPATINYNDPLQQVRRHVDTSIFMGRDSDVRSVVGMLCNPDPHPPQDSHSLTPNNRLSVVAIVGLGE